MRRTNEEFRDEVLRRQQAYHARQKQKRKKAMTTALCVVMVIFGGVMTLPLLGGMAMGGSAENAMAPMGIMDAAPAEAPAAAEPEYAMGQSDGKAEYAKEQIRMVMIDGVLYFDTGYYNGEPRKCGTFSGEITSEVDGSMIPEENDQSNFGVGYGYQYVAMDGTIEIYMNGKWRIFATEEAMAQFTE